MNDVRALDWVKDLIESQHKRSILLAAALIAWWQPAVMPDQERTNQEGGYGGRTSQLAHIMSIREAQFVAKHADAVVDRDSLTIRQYLGWTRSARPPPALWMAP